MMSKLKLVIACLYFGLSAFNLMGQGNRFMPFEELWAKISLAHPDSAPAKTDTMLVMYSNRIMQDTSARFFSHLYNENQPLKPLLAICKNLEWTIYPMASLDEAMSYLPENRNLLVYIEGLGKNFPIAMYRGAGMTTQYGMNVLMLDYPTLNESYDLIRNYYFAERSSKASAVNYAQLLKELVVLDSLKKPWIFEKHLVVFHHSLGNAMLRNALKLNLLVEIPNDFVDRLILNAPCVVRYRHAAWLNQAKYAKETFVLYNKSDFELMGAAFLKHRFILGARPLWTLADSSYYVDLHPLLKKKHNSFINKPGRPKIPDEAQLFYKGLFNGISFPFEGQTLVHKKNNSYKLLPK